MKTARCMVALGAAALAVSVSSAAMAQGGVGGTWGTGGGAPGGWGAPGTSAPPGRAPTQESSDFEVGSLYVAAATYGVGTGIWIDAETGLRDPGLRFIPPAVLGVAAPIGVFFLDQPKLPRGVPGAITMGLSVGAMSGFLVWNHQHVTSKAEDEWGFRELSRTTFIGATVGGAAGAAVGFLEQPSPKLSLFVGSSALWGLSAGAMFGYGASPDNGGGWGANNDYASYGGLTGFGVGLIGSAALSSVWVPTYKQQAFMWMGAGVGFGATLPVYLFYAGDEAPTKRGLVVQGTGTLLGIAAGAVFTMYDPDWVLNASTPGSTRPRFAQVTGVSPMVVPGGLGAQLAGVLF